MSRQHRPPAPQAGVGGPLVALCLGQRCSALRRLAGTADSVDALGSAVRQTPGAVLVTAGCLGACALSSVAAVAHRRADSETPGASLWLSGVQTPERADGLAAWVAAGGPGSTDRPDSRLPSCLREAVAGFGPPVRLAPGTPPGQRSAGGQRRSPG